MSGADYAPLDLPTYRLPWIGDGMLPVRRLGYSPVHLASVPSDLVILAKWNGPTYYGVVSPVVAVCGRVLRSASLPVVVMQKPDSVTCRDCRWVAHSGTNNA